MTFRFDSGLAPFFIQGALFDKAFKMGFIATGGEFVNATLDVLRRMQLINRVEEKGKKMYQGVSFGAV